MTQRERQILNWIEENPLISQHPGPLAPNPRGEILKTHGRGAKNRL